MLLAHVPSSATTEELPSTRGMMSAFLRTHTIPRSTWASLDAVRRAGCRAFCETPPKKPACPLQNDCWFSESPVQCVFLHDLREYTSRTIRRFQVLLWRDRDSPLGPGARSHHGSCKSVTHSTRRNGMQFLRKRTLHHRG